MLAPTGTLLCFHLTEYTGCCVTAGCEGQWGHLSETEEQTGSQIAGQYSAGCSLPPSGFCGRFQGVNFCSVVEAQVTSLDGEGEGGSI